LWRREYRLDVQPFDARFSGTGDLLAALLLGWSCRPAVPVRDTLRRAVSSVQAVLRAAMRDEPQPHASAAGARKPAIALRLEGSIDAIRCPAENDVPPPTRLDAPLQGVIFDMDGTLVSVRAHRQQLQPMQRGACCLHAQCDCCCALGRHCPASSISRRCARP